MRREVEEYSDLLAAVQQREFRPSGRAERPGDWRCECGSHHPGHAGACRSESGHWHSRRWRGLIGQVNPCCAVGWVVIAEEYRLTEAAPCSGARHLGLYETLA